MSKAKQNTLLLLLVVGLLTILLAMSLSKVVLLPGTPVSFERPESAPVADFGAPAANDLVLLILRGFTALALIALPISIIYSLQTAQGRRRLLAYIVLLVILLFVSDYMHSRSQLPDRKDPQQINPQANNVANRSQATDSTVAASFPANPPSWLTLAIILGASVLAALLILAAVWYLRQHEQPAVTSLDKLAEEAQNAIESLQLGGDFGMTIIRCYQEMSRVVKEEKDIAREIAMTPREFEERLVSRGLPQEAVGTLTRLFEQARYGGVQAHTPEETLAFSCLTDIANACKGRRG